MLEVLTVRFLLEQTLWSVSSTVPPITPNMAPWPTRHSCYTCVAAMMGVPRHVNSWPVENIV